MRHTFKSMVDIACRWALWPAAELFGAGRSYQRYIGRRYLYYVRQGWPDDTWGFCRSGSGASCQEYGGPEFHMATDCSHVDDAGSLIAVH